MQDGLWSSSMPYNISAIKLSETGEFGRYKIKYLRRRKPLREPEDEAKERMLSWDV